MSRDELLSNLAHALGALCQEAMNNLTLDARRAVHERLSSGQGRLQVVCQLDPMVVVGQLVTSDPKAEPVQLFRITSGQASSDPSGETSH